jgi:hypothetical protein
MSAPTQFTGTVKAWTTSRWRGIDSVLHSVQGGELDEAASLMTYTNHDMSTADEWVEVGVATITVTLHPREDLVAKELEGLNTQLQNVRAENQRRENAILDRISKLQALDYVGEGA